MAVVGRPEDGRRWPGACTVLLEKGEGAARARGGKWEARVSVLKKKTLNANYIHKCIIIGNTLKTKNSNLSPSGHVQHA